MAVAIVARPALFRPAAGPPDLDHLRRRSLDVTAASDATSARQRHPMGQRLPIGQPRSQQRLDTQRPLAQPGPASSGGPSGAKSALGCRRCIDRGRRGTAAALRRGGLSGRRPGSASTEAGSVGPTIDANVTQATAPTRVSLRPIGPRLIGGDIAGLDVARARQVPRVRQQQAHLRRSSPPETTASGGDFRFRNQLLPLQQPPAVRSTAGFGRRRRAALLHAIAERAQDRGEILAGRAGQRRHRLRDDKAAAVERAGRLVAGEALSRHDSAGRMRSARRSRISTRTARSPHCR